MIKLGEVLYDGNGKTGILYEEDIDEVIARIGKFPDNPRMIKKTIKFDDGTEVHPRSDFSYHFFVRKNECNNSH